METSIEKRRRHVLSPTHVHVKSRAQRHMYFNDVSDAITLPTWPSSFTLPVDSKSSFLLQRRIMSVSLWEAMVFFV